MLRITNKRNAFERTCSHLRNYGNKSVKFYQPQQRCFSSLNHLHSESSEKFSKCNNPNENSILRNERLKPEYKFNNFYTVTFSHHHHTFSNELGIIPRKFRSYNEKSAFHEALYKVAIRNFSSSSSKLNEDGDKKSTPKANFSTKSSSGNAQSKSSPETSSGSSNSFSTTAVSNPPAQKSIQKRIKCAIKAAARSLASFIASTPGVLWFYLTNPKALREKLIELKEAAKHEAHHYWMGTKLLAADIKTARAMLWRLLSGSSLTRRERKQLIRTTTDLFRLVPFSIFVIIPFMEFALPFALRIFPDLLPSTYQDSLKEEENMKRELQSRIAMAGFFQETLQNLANEQKKTAKKRKEIKEESSDENDDTTCIEVEREETAASFLEFVDNARKGEAIPSDMIIKYATYFKDELTLDNMSRMQLINLCKYMNIPPYGADSLLRFQLRHRIRNLQEDDQRILWEGINELTKQELREACRERGMRSTGLTKDGYKNSLQQWLDLSVNKNVPISLLIMSRIFFLQDGTPSSRVATPSSDDKTLTSIADAISGLEKGVVNEVVLDVASSDNSADYMKIKLEVLQTQNELIKEEKELREKERKEKEQKEKEKELDEKELEISDNSITKELEASSTEKSSGEKESPTTKIIVVDESEQNEADVKVVRVTTEPTQDDEEKKKEEKEENDLSPQEMEAIYQMISPNAVVAEKEELERIKASLLSSEEDLQDTPIIVVKPENKESTDESIKPDAKSKQQKDKDETLLQSNAEEDQEATKTIRKMDSDAAKIAEESTSISFDMKQIDEKKETESEVSESHADKGEEEEEEVESGSGDAALDKSVERLKSRVEGMIGKIEKQLSDVETKIGNKLHLLDKDMDGVLSREEMMEFLQQALKRKLTPEMATAIVEDMDSNEDGLITVAELIHWIDTHKLVKLAEEGRDVDLDKEMNKKLEKSSAKAEKNLSETQSSTPEGNEEKRTSTHKDGADK